ncbi:MAG: hypothetical protein J6Q68_03925 [Clostridia bacterium]|nr:hypothetical protein [Clostridia bacterium]
MIIKLCGIAVIGAICAFLLKGLGWRGGALISVGSVIAVLSFIGVYFEKIGEIFDTVSRLEGAEESIKTILKILGVGYVGGISSDICRELGEQGIASVIVTVSRMETLLIVSPMLLSVLKLGLEMAQ